MVNPEIRKLQFLNDLITQTLDVISARGPVAGLMGGLSHSPYNDVSSLYGVGNVYPQSLIGANPFLASQIPQMMGNLSHTPFGLGGFVPGFGAGLGNATSPFIQAGLGQGLPMSGLSHTPFAWPGAASFSGIGSPFQSLYTNPLVQQRFAATGGFPLW